MITMTAREVLKGANFYANIRNASLTDFYYNTKLLNSAYTQLYVDIVKETDSFVNYFDFIDEAELPEDCYLVLSVYRVYNDGSLEEIQMMPKDQILYSGSYYRIENNVIKAGGKPGFNASTYRVKYAPMPETLTAPDEPKTIDITYTEIGTLSDEGFYYKNDGKDYFYSFKDDSSSETSTYEAYTLPDLSAYERDGLTIISGDIDAPYAAVTYSDNDTYIYTGDEAALYNISQIKGHKTDIEALRLHTDDTTGKGLLYTENGTLRYGSFVPDTVLSYPSQIYFTVLELRIASLLSSLNGMTNQLLEDKLLPEAEVKLYETLKPSTKPYRQANIMRHMVR